MVIEHKVLGRFVHSIGRRNEDGALSIISSTFRRQRILSDVELIGMLNELEMEFLRSVYDKHARVKFCKANEISQMRSEAHQLFHSGLHYTQQEIEELLTKSKPPKSLAKTLQASSTNVDESKQAQKAERLKRRTWMYALKSDWEARVNELSKTLPNEHVLRYPSISDPKLAKVLPKKQAHDMETISDFRVLSRRLNHSHKITSVGTKGQNTSTIQNILLVRDEKPSNKRLPWNSTCCFSKSIYQ